MADNEQTRSQYLQALLNQRKTFNASGNNLVNPSVSNNVEELALQDTNFQQGVSDVNVPTQKDINGVQQSGDKSDKGVLSSIFGFVDEIAAKFGAGFVSGWEGILDLGATGLGALGEATGWYDGKVFTDWAKQDIGTALAEWTKTYANFTLHGIISNAVSGNYANADYWKGLASGVINIGKEAMPWTKPLVNYALENNVPTYFKENASGQIRDYRNDANKFYAMNDEALQDMGGFGEFLGGAAHSIGMMLPSIMTAGAAKGAQAADAVVKGVSLATLGLGAGGKGSEEALNEGASAGRALAYGAVSGGAEVLSELAVGPVLAKVGLGTGKIAGVIGKKTVKTTSKSFIKELVKDAFEEGMEEVSTALVEPLIKSIYKGQEALDEYKDPAKFFLGVGGNFNESVLGQFASGAFTGGIMSGVNINTQIKTYGKNGVPVVENYGDYMENVAKTLKYEKGTAKYNKAVEDAMSAYGKLVESWNTAQSSLTEQQLDNLRNALSNPAEFYKSNEIGSKNFIENKVKQLNTINKAQSYKVFSDLTRSAGTGGYTLEFTEMNSNDYASVDHTNKIVKLNSKYEGRYGAGIAHDYVSHVIVEMFGGQSKVNSLYDRISKTSFFTKYSDSLTEEYKTKDENYKNLIKEGKTDLAEDYFKREVVANYIGNVVYNKGGNFAQLKYVKSLFEKEGIFKKLINKFKGVKTNDTIMNEVKSLVKTVISANNNSTFKSLTKKLEEGKKLNDKEMALYKGNKEFFESAQFAFASKKTTKSKSNDTQKNTDVNQSKKSTKSDSDLSGRYELGEAKTPSTIEKSEKGYNVYKDGILDRYNISEEEVKKWIKENKATKKKGLPRAKQAKRVNLYSKKEFYFFDESGVYEAKVVEKNNKFSLVKTNLETSEITTKKYNSMNSLYREMKVNTSLTYEKNTAVDNYKKSKTNKNSLIDTTETKSSYKGDKLLGKYTVNKGTSNAYTIEVTMNAEGKKGFTITENGKTVPIDFTGIDAREKVAKYLKDNNAIGTKGKNFNNYETDKSFKRDTEKYRKSFESDTKIETSETSGKKNVVQENKKTSAETVTKESKATRKTKKDTDAYVRNITKVFKEIFGKDYKAIMPKSFSNFASVFYTTTNSSNVVDTQIKRCMELLNGVYVNQYNAETRTDNVLGTVQEVATEEQLNKLRENLKTFIENGNVASKNNEIKSLEVRNDRSESKVREVKETAVQTKTLVNQRRIVKDVFLKDAKIVEDDIAKYGYQQMWKPIQELKSIEGGFSSEGVKANFEALRGQYADIKKQAIEDQVIPYEPEVEDLITNIIDSLGQSVDGTNARLGAETTELIKQYARVVSHLVSETKKNFTIKIMPSAMQAKKALASSKYGTNKNVLAKAFRAYKRGFAPAYVVISQMFGGNSVLRDVLVYDVQVAKNSKDMYIGVYHDQIKSELKRLKLLSNYDNIKVDVYGKKLTLDQALYLYNSLKVEANFNAINDSGLSIYNKNGNIEKMANAGNAEVILNDLERTLTNEQKEFADFLLTTMNGSVKAEYIEFYKKRFGAFSGSNEIGEINEKKYWTLMRDTYSMSNIEKASKNPDAIFSQSRSRVNSTNKVLIGGALSNFNYYIDKLSTELYLKPVYRDALSIINYGKEESVYQELKNKVDPQDLTYLKNTMSDIVGALNNKNDKVQRISAMFSVSKLALNIGSSAKQFLSLFTSNLPLSKSFQAFIKSRITDRTDFSKEMKMLLGEIDGYEGIGGLKYRGTNAVVEGNVGKVSKTLGKITNVTMFGIKAVDLFTIKSGVYTLMLIGETQANAKVGTEANYKFVVEHWSDFELSQVGNSALSKSGVHRGDYDSMPRAIFSLLQGANRACLGSQLNKIDLYNRNKNVSKSQLLEEQKNATKALEDFKNSKSIDGQFDVRNLSEEDAQKYVELQSNKLDVDLRVKDYNRFKLAGGKKIPLNMAGGLVIQGLFATLINELMKHLKGKKDWDDWDLLEIGTSSAMAMFLDWIPLVNTFTSIAKGYDVQVPAVAILNEISAISKYIQNGNTSALVRELATFLGDFSGIPFTTVYEYIYGAIKTFNPAIAYDMNSVFYGSTTGNATKTLNKYVAKGDERNTLAMVGVCMNNYRVQTSDIVAKEITRLLLAGEQNVMPKQYMTSYTNENGENVKLTSEQIRQFRQYYDLSDKMVSTAIKESDYSKLSNSQRSKALKKIYDAYYGYARYKVLGTKPSSKLEKLLCYTNGNVDLAKYIVYLQEIAEMTESKSKTRKEVVASFINKLQMTKNEKTLLMYLAGFTPNDESKKSLEKFLRSKGASPYEIGEIL